jgi:monovalent cation:H+ antiporter-2, CPA2 family
MHESSFLHDLAVVMIVAALVTVLFHRFKQPVVLGYIMAGVIVGPHTPPFPLIDDETTIKTLAELGVVFLMFALGLEFDLRQLKKVGPTAFIAATLEILLMIWVGYEMGRWFGWKPMDCIFLGAMLSISSTTIILKALTELGRSKEPFAELIFGVLVVEDILAMVMIALLSGIAMTGSLEAGQVILTVGRLCIFLAVVLVLGLLGVPRFLNYVARFQSKEMLLIAVLGLCFGVSLLAVKLQYSVALGAFLMGAVMAEAREISRIEALVEPLKDMFSAVFFVAIGLLIDPRMLIEHALPIGLITLAVVVGKVGSCAFGAFAAGHDTRTALRVGMGLAQIGEFSFIIASLGLTLGVISGFLYPIAVTVSAITTLVTPYLIKGSDRFVNWFDHVAPPRLVSCLQLYTQWLGRWRETRHQSMTTRLMRKWTWQMALNLVLVAGIFIGSAFVARKPPSWLSQARLGPDGLKAMLWLGAMLLSMPLLIATYRKLQALGMLVGEVIAARMEGKQRASAVHAIVANTMPWAGVVGVAQLLLLLSSAILPSLEVLVLLILILAGLAFLWRRAFIRIYAKAQFALEETFSKPPAARYSDQPAGPLGKLITSASLMPISIAKGSPSAGQRIGDLRLRTRTGASIVAIQRADSTLENPGADVVVLANDRLHLLGTRSQLDLARNLLLEQAPMAGNSAQPDAG